MKVTFVNLRIHYKRIKSEIDETIGGVIADSAFIGGKYVRKFEEEFAVFTGSKHIIGVGNGTDALILALRSLNFETGFEVIVPANLFIATAEAVTYAGGRIVFCDVDSKTYLIDLTHAETLVTSRTCAIIPVHLYGQMMDMKKVRYFVDHHGLVIIEDAAQAHGARYDGVSVGDLSELACYSFYPAKNLGAYGDGGGISTNNDPLAMRIRMMANHVRVAKYDHEIEGINSRLDGLQSAILSVKLRYLDQWNRQRQEAAEYYHQCLKHLDLPLPKCNSQGRHVYYLFVTRVKNRNHVIRELKNCGVAAGIHYPIALPFLKAYSYMN